MSKLSCSFTLGKASGGNANIEHNNREFISSNVDVTKLADNVVYVRQDVRAVYDELFGESLAEYNTKQKRNDRKIHDYYEHISQGGREESHYEIIVQFGDASTAGIDTLDGKFAIELLDEYMQSFQKRNPNLRVFNAVLHADETTPHIHINFVPYYTQGRQKGLSQGVSMRSALEEQGFSNSNKKMNSLVAWENSEMNIMEDILNGRGIKRDVIGATHAHKSVPQYKESQDWRKLPKRKKNLSTLECYDVELRKTQQEMSLLKIENDKLTTERNSQWRSLFYSDSDKQIFVQSKLAELNIPYRESENGIEVQSCHIEKIRNIEMQYTLKPTSHRDILRDKLDRIVMCAKDFDDIFEGLKFYGYEVKHGKYISVKPPNGNQFIRLKSLGEMYNEQALRNRIDNRKVYENQIDETLKSFAAKGSGNLLEYRCHATVRQYIITFKKGVLPVRKKNPKQPFTWINDAELDRLTSLNKKINAGATLTSLRNDLAESERSISEIETNLATLETELKTFARLQKSAVLIFEKNNHNPTARKFLAEHDITVENYSQIAETIDSDTSKITELKQSLTEVQSKIKDTSETLTAFERIMSMTYVDSLVTAEKDSRQSAVIGNGVKSADSSMSDSMRIDKIAAKVAEPQPAYKPKRK